MMENIMDHHDIGESYIMMSGEELQQTADVRA